MCVRMYASIRLSGSSAFQLSLSLAPLCAVYSRFFVCVSIYPLASATFSFECRGFSSRGVGLFNEIFRRARLSGEARVYDVYTALPITFAIREWDAWRE